MLLERWKNTCFERVCGLSWQDEACIIAPLSQLPIIISSCIYEHEI